jgi:hypothetical protein
LISHSLRRVRARRPGATRKPARSAETGTSRSTMRRAILLKTRRPRGRCRRNARLPCRRSDYPLHSSYSARGRPGGDPATRAPPFLAEAASRAISLNSSSDPCPSSSRRPSPAGGLPFASRR